MNLVSLKSLHHRCKHDGQSHRYWVLKSMEKHCLVMSSQQDHKWVISHPLLMHSGSKELVYLLVPWSLPDYWLHFHRAVFSLLEAHLWNIHYCALLWLSRKKKKNIKLQMNNIINLHFTIWPGDACGIFCMPQNWGEMELKGGVFFFPFANGTYFCCGYQEKKLLMPEIFHIKRQELLIKLNYRIRLKSLFSLHSEMHEFFI